MTNIRIAKVKIQKLLIYILFALCSVTSTYAGSPGLKDIRGKVYDATGVLPGAVVLLLNTSDSAIIKSAVTDTAGIYDMPGIPVEKFLLKFVYVGMKDTIITIDPLNVNTDHATIDMQLYTTTNKLSGVTISYKRPLIELKNDKIIFNVSSRVYSAGLSAFDLFAKLPGVIVDNNDNVLLHGKSNVSIYIDGKLSPLAQSDIIYILKTIPSSEIDRIEVINNPSSKFDASGNGGIINIITKKGLAYGLNGNISSTYTQGHTAKTSNSIALNYRTKNFIFFGSAGALNEGFDRNLHQLRQQANDNNQLIGYDLTTTERSTHDNYNYNGGLTCNISKTNVLGFKVDGLNNRDGFTTSGNTLIYQNISHTDSILSSKNIYSSNRYYTNYSLNFDHTDSSNTKVSAVFDFGTFNIFSSNDQPNTFYSDNAHTSPQHIDFRNSGSTRITIYSGKADIEVPLWGGTMAAGIKGSYVSTNNTFDFYNINSAGIAVPDTSYSNKFKFTEAIGAAYINYVKTVKKFDYQFGIRPEYTSNNGLLTTATVTNNKTNNNKFLNLFPSASLSYNANENNVVGLAYGRRIDRPNYEQLNPFEKRESLLQFDKGNPFLKSQYSDDVSLSYIYHKIFTTQLDFNRITGFLNQIVDTAKGNSVIYIPQNIGINTTVSLNFTLEYALTKYWSALVNCNIYYQHLQGSLVNGHLDNTITSYQYYMENSFKLPRSFSVTLVNYFYGPFYYGAFKNRAMQGTDIGIEKKLGSSWNIKLLGVNVFNTMIIRSNLNFGGVYINTTDRNENRFIKVSATYKFGKKTVAPAPDLKASSEAERGRL